MAPTGSDRVQGLLDLALTMSGASRALLADPAGDVAAAAGAPLRGVSDKDLTQAAGRGQAVKGAPFFASAPVVEKLKTLARERPMLAAGAALAAGVFAVKNPKALMPLVLAFLEPKKPRRH